MKALSLYCPPKVTFAPLVHRQPDPTAASPLSSVYALAYLLLAMVLTCYTCQS